MSFRTLAFGALLLAGAGPAAAQGVQLEFAAGRVTLVAQNVPARVILAEWARLGGTRIVNGERVAGPPITLELAGVPERQALDIVLRGVAGYMITARDGGSGVSQIDHIMILPTSTAPRAASPTPTFGVRAPTAELPQDDAFGDEPAEAPGRGRVILPRPGVSPTVPDPTAPRAVTIQSGTPQTFVPAPAAAPAPAPAGPAATPPPANPFSTLPGSSRPGEVTPVPTPENRGPTNTPGAQER